MDSLDKEAIASAVITAFDNLSREYDVIHTVKVELNDSGVGVEVHGSVESDWDQIEYIHMSGSGAIRAHHVLAGK